MTATEYHDDIVRRIENHRTRMQEFAPQMKIAHYLALVFFLVWVIGVWRYVSSDLFLGLLQCTGSFVFYAVIWFCFSLILDPKASEYDALHDELELLLQEKQDFEATHRRIVTWICDKP